MENNNEPDYFKYYVADVRKRRSNKGPLILLIVLIVLVLGIAGWLIWFPF